MKGKTLFKEFFQYVTLNICGMIGLSCYILADTFFISKKLGANGLAALNLAIPIYSFIHGFGLMLGMGGATKYSIFRGQKNFSLADNVYSAALFATAVSSVFFLAAGALFSGNLAVLLGADGEIFDMTKIYLQVILLFAPIFMTNNLLLCFVRNDGNPKLSMTAMLVGSFSNIVLDYVFLFPLHMGIFGAVLATGCAPVISLTILSRHWTAKQNQFHLKKAKPSPSLTRTIISLGIPSLITEVASGIVMIVFNTVILTLQGNIGVAAYGVVANLSLVITSVYTGIAQGAQPILSRLYGYNDPQSIRQVFKYAAATALMISFCVYFFFLAAAQPVVGIFNSEQNRELQQIAETGLKLYFMAIPFVGFNIILSTYFTSTEQAFPAQIVSLSRGFFVILPMAFLMSSFFQMTGVWLSYPLTESIVAVAGIRLYIKKSKTSTGGKKHVSRNAQKKTDVI